MHIIRIPRGEFMWMTIKVYKHVTYPQTTSELIKDNHRLTFIIIKGMIIIRDSIDIGIAVFINDAPCLSSTRRTIYVSNIHITELILILFFTEHLADPINLLYV